MSEITKLKTPGSTASFETVPKGMFIARCYKMIDLGTQPGRKMGKAIFKPARKIMLFFELFQTQKGDDVFMEDGERRFSINVEYSWSMWKTANLRQALDSWRGEPFTDKEAEGFEITKLLGVYGLIQIFHESKGERTYSKIASIMPTDQLEETPDGANNLTSFSIEDPDLDMFETFPGWIKDKIREASEWKVETHDGKINDAGEVEIENLESPAGLTQEDLEPIKTTPF